MKSTVVNILALTAICSFSTSLGKTDRKLGEIKMFKSNELFSGEGLWNTPHVRIPHQICELKYVRLGPSPGKNLACVGLYLEDEDRVCLTWMEPLYLQPGEWTTCAAPNYFSEIYQGNELFWQRLFGIINPMMKLIEEQLPMLSYLRDIKTYKNKKASPKYQNDQ